MRQHHEIVLQKSERKLLTELKLPSVSFSFIEYQCILTGVYSGIIQAIKVSINCDLCEVKLYTKPGIGVTSFML